MVTYLHKRVHSFKYAWKGIRLGWEEEANFRFQTVCAALALALAFVLQISRIEWLLVLLAMGIVLTAELINTSLEELCDMLQPSHDPHIAKIKDLAAGAVFLSSWVALLIGAFVFIPRFISLL